VQIKMRGGKVGEVSGDDDEPAMKRMSWLVWKQRR
jgi:hypothetical protein